MLVSYYLLQRRGHEAKMHEKENNIMRPRRERGQQQRDRERGLKFWPTDPVSLENLTSWTWRVYWQAVRLRSRQVLLRSLLLSAR